LTNGADRFVDRLFDSPLELLQGVRVDRGELIERSSRAVFWKPFRMAASWASR
jgi:hypothetical protein